MHGKTSVIEHDGLGVFARQAPSFRATRYHSLIVDESTLPADLMVSARAGSDNAIMGVRHGALPIEGVQFHPESILTDEGITLFRSFVERVGEPARD